MEKQKQSKSKTKLKAKKNIDVLLSWEAAERIWSPKSKVWYLSSAAVVLVLMLIAVRLNYFFLILVLIAFLFLWFVQGTIPPWIVSHKLTSKGLITNSNLFVWENFSYFWFARKGDQILLYFDFPKEAKEPRITLLINNEDAQRIFDIAIAEVKYGTMDEVEYNIFAKIVFGEYISVKEFIADLDDFELKDQYSQSIEQETDKLSKSKHKPKQAENKTD